MAESLPKGREIRRKSIDNPVPAMSSSSGPLSEELQCSVCLDVFSDPVSTPCGHNFCKTCLNKCWDNSQTCFCPNCKDTFRQRPDLKINTILRDIADHYKQKSSEEKPEVLCDLCEDTKLKALKSCLVCQSSYCKTHLEPHLKVTGLKKHKLMDPVRNLEAYICQKHQRHLEFFCRDDQTCVCPMCLVTDHKNHNTVPLEEKSEEKIQKDIQLMIQDRNKKIQDLKHSSERRKSFYTELLEMMEQQQKAAEELKEELIEELEQEITELKSRNTELEQLSHTEDHLHLLQIYSDLCHSDPKSCSVINVKTQEKLRRDLTELKNTIQEKLKQTGLQWIKTFAVDVILDPDTAHPQLILSRDGKQARHQDMYLNLPDTPQRFDCYVFVLGKEGFTSGRFYFEVQVKGKTRWTLGVARKSINRKGALTVRPSYGYWTVGLDYGNQYWARGDPLVPLSPRVIPQRVGVFVDYEEGLVSFSEVESRSHIYSFTDQIFTEKLYPCFNPCSNDGGENLAPMIITPVDHSH